MRKKVVTGIYVVVVLSVVLWIGFFVSTRGKRVERDCVDSGLKMMQNSLILSDNFFAKNIKYCLKEVSSRDAFVCPCCGYCGHMDDVEKGFCPKCKNRPRHRRLCYLLAHKDIDEVMRSSDFRLLFWGPDPTVLSGLKNVLLDAQVINMDVFPPNYVWMKEKNLGDLFKADVQDIPLPNRFVKGEIISHVLEHVIDISKATKETIRVIKPGGFLINEVACGDFQYKGKGIFNCREASKEDRLDAIGLDYCPESHVWIYGCKRFWEDYEKFSGMKCIKFEEFYPKNSITNQAQLESLTRYDTARVCWIDV